MLFPDMTAIGALPASAGWASVLFLIFWLLRIVVKTTRKDLNEFKADSATGEGISTLQGRVEMLDARVNKLERERSKLIAFCSKVLMHFSGCGSCPGRQAQRDELVEEYQRIMEEITR